MATSVRSRLNRLKQHLISAENAASNIDSLHGARNPEGSWLAADRLVVHLRLALDTALELKHQFDAQMERKDARMERKGGRP